MVRDAAGRMGLRPVFLFLASFLLSIAAAIWLMRESVGPARQMQFAVWASVFLAFVMPLAIIFIRHEVRLSRIKLIELFAGTFNFASPGEQGRPPPPDRHGGQNVSFEFVKGKYYADLDLDSPDQMVANVPRFPMLIRSDWMILICAIPFMVIAWFGSFILLAPLVEVWKIKDSSAIGGWLWPSMLALGGSNSLQLSGGAQFEMQHVNVLTVAVLAFSGAYFFSLRLLLRAVAVFDLSPITFLRCFLHVLMAMLLAVVIYRVFPSGEGFASALSRTGEALQVMSGAKPASSSTAPTSPGLASPAPAADPAPAKPDAPPAGAPSPAPAPPAGAAGTSGTPAPGSTSPPASETNGVGSIWLIFAFALGFIPDAALQFVLQKAGLTFKERYGDLDRHAKLVPLTVIDGIDNFIAFRLEEANIFDVQNLATANPIMLHIESPFGIYETIDWVAQAQLCIVTGPDRFLLLKTFNIRTIFDLERAVMKPVPDLPEETLTDLAAAAAADAARAEMHRQRTQFALKAASERQQAVAADDAAKQAAAEAVAKAQADDAAADLALQRAQALASAMADAVAKTAEAAAACAAVDPRVAGRLSSLGPSPPCCAPGANDQQAVNDDGKPPAGARDDFIKAIGEILIRDNGRDAAMRVALKMDPKAYSGATPPSVETVRSMVEVMLDDLHVHRLRQIWKHIRRQLGAANAHL